jgi:hypothetical protein
MKIASLFYLFITGNNYFKKIVDTYIKSYHLEELPDYFTSNNNSEILFINNNNETIVENYNINKNIDGYDNRNITEEDNLHKIIKQNKIKNNLDFLLSNRSEIEKVLFIEHNDILRMKNNNIFDEEFDFFK